MTYISDRLAHWVESTGIELPVTLYVPGALVVGHLAPVRRYLEWQDEVLRRALLGGGTFVAGGGAVPGPTPQQQARTAEEWRERYGEMADYTEMKFPELCIRNAELRAGPPEEWRRYPMLLVQSANVCLATLGHKHET